MKIANRMFVLMLSVLLASSLYAQEEVTEEKKAEVEETETFTVSRERIELSYPVSWKKTEPASRIVEFEIAVPMAEGDEKDGRLTIMGAGGSIEANIDRWKGQFSQEDGSSTSDHTKVDEIEVDGVKVHMVDITGTFRDQRGPVAPAVQREGYRMLAAIVETDVAGNYFLKLYGPAKTIAENEERFKDFVNSIKVTPDN